MQKYTIFKIESKILKNAYISIKIGICVFKKKQYFCTRF
jgi:hypothetical protein